MPTPSPVPDWIQDAEKQADEDLKAWSSDDDVIDDPLPEWVDDAETEGEEVEAE